jgi:phosphotriesterase-related protein
LKRREFLSASLAACIGPAQRDSEPSIMTVRGEIPAARMGITLPHEHILVDFIGADKVSPSRYDPDVVFKTMLPHLTAARKRGVGTFIDCTPNFLGRDPILLRRLSTAAKLHIVTNTGLYKEPYLPAYAFSESADQLSERWIKEAESGVGKTEIRPGFIKIAVNPGRLIPIQQKIVRAAARTSKQMGMVIACHAGNGPAALEALGILREENLRPDRFIFVHAEGETERKYHVDLARAGAWVEYDAVGWRPINDHVRLISAFLGDGLINRLLVSHDAGWYHVGEKDGGEIKPFTPLLAELVPALEKEGMTSHQKERILFENPRRAFGIRRPARSAPRIPSRMDWEPGC